LKNIFRVVSMEVISLKNLQMASASALKSFRSSLMMRVTFSNDVSTEAFSGKIVWKLPEKEISLSFQRFEAQAVYAFIRIGSG